MPLHGWFLPVLLYCGLRIKFPVCFGRMESHYRIVFTSTIILGPKDFTIHKVPHGQAGFHLGGGRGRKGATAPPWIFCAPPWV